MNGFKRLLIVALLPLAGFAFYLSGVWSLWWKFENFDTQIALMKRQVIDNKLTVKPRILIAGDSTALTGLHAKMFGRSAYSLALANGSSIETFFALRDFIKSRPPPDCILLGLSHQWPAYKTFFWRTFARAGFFSGSDLEEIYRAAHELEAFPARTYPPWSYLALSQLHRARLMGLGLSDIQAAIFDPPELPVALRIKRVALSQGSWILNRTIIPKPPTAKLPEGDPEPLFEHFEQKIFELAREKRIPLYYIQIPVSPSETGRVPQAANGVQVVLSNIEWQASDFSFPRHLTEAGATKLFNHIHPRVECFRPD